jgi:hypothetical protein
MLHFLPFRLLSSRERAGGRIYPQIINIQIETDRVEKTLTITLTEPEAG